MTADMLGRATFTVSGLNLADLQRRAHAIATELFDRTEYMIVRFSVAPVALGDREEGALQRWQVEVEVAFPVERWVPG